MRPAAGARAVRWRHWGARAWAAPWTAAGLALGAAAWAAGARWRVVDGVIEVSGGRLGAWAAGGVGPRAIVALTLGHVVLAATPGWMAALRAHERVHVAQYGRWGPLFVPAYFAAGAWAWLRGRDPYRDNAFERPAFAAQGGGMPSAGDDAAGAGAGGGDVGVAAAGGRGAGLTRPAAAPGPASCG